VHTLLWQCKRTAESYDVGRATGGELVHGENNMLGKMVRELGLDTADVFSVFQVNTSRPEYEYFYLGTLSRPGRASVWTLVPAYASNTTRRCARSRSQRSGTQAVRPAQ
jgi:hypothetical protein